MKKIISLFALIVICFVGFANLVGFPKTVLGENFSTTL